MTRTASRSLAMLGLWACLAAQALLGASACAQSERAKPHKAAPAIDIADLYGHWVQSGEEQGKGGSVQIFRPSGSVALPPSRFRMAYKFHRDGTCEFYFLSPDDAHRFRPCTWKLTASDKPLLQIVADEKTASFRIVELSGKVLRLGATRHAGR